MKASGLRHELVSIAKSRSYIALVLILFALFTVIAYTTSYAETSSADRYISISTLDENMTSNAYFSHTNSTVKLSEKMNWNVQLYNHMPTPEFISVRAKIVNASNMKSSNDAEPFQAPTAYEKRILLDTNSTFIFPFNWSLVTSGPGNSSNNTVGLYINGAKAENLIAIRNQTKMGIVFEVWTYDASAKDFTYGWKEATGQKVAWNRIWFSVAT